AGRSRRLGSHGGGARQVARRRRRTLAAPRGRRRPRGPLRPRGPRLARPRRRRARERDPHRGRHLVARAGPRDARCRARVCRRRSPDRGRAAVHRRAAASRPSVRSPHYAEPVPATTDPVDVSTEEADAGSREATHSVDELLDLAVEELGGSRREGQHAMARAVADALGSGEALLVQAGTGTGKSLAYLVPAVHHAVTSDEPVIVSTATIALQRQVVTRDLPLVAEALADRLPRTPRTALLKGWQNYVCRNKLEGGYPEDEPVLFDAPGRGQTSDL